MEQLKFHLLIVDDNEDILQMLELMLKMKGFMVSVKKNVVDIESYIVDLQPDIILMDMFLAGTDGKHICRQIKGNTSIAHIPLIMISAYHNVEQECVDAGANGFLYKPFEMKALLKMVYQLLEIKK